MFEKSCLCFEDGVAKIVSTRDRQRLSFQLAGAGRAGNSLPRLCVPLRAAPRRWLSRRRRERGVRWLVCRSVGRAVGQSFGRLVDWFVGRLGWSIPDSLLFPRVLREMYGKLALRTPTCGKRAFVLPHPYPLSCGFGFSCFFFVCFVFSSRENLFSFRFMMFRWFVWNSCFHIVRL